MWLHQYRDKNNLVAIFGPSPVSNRRDTIRRALALDLSYIPIRYVGVRETEATSCNSLLNAMSMAYGIFDGRA